MLAWWLAQHHEDAADAAQVAHDVAEGGAHGAEHAEQHIPELPNLIGTLHHWLPEQFPTLKPFFDTFDNAE